MSTSIGVVLFLFASLVFADVADAQIDDICAEAGITPSLDSPFAHVPYIYGRVTVKGLTGASKFPNVVVVYADRQQPVNRQTIGKSGNYCFKRSASGGGTLLVEVGGEEMARRALPPAGGSQQREDFEVIVNQPASLAPPGVISSKFARPPNDKTAELYKKVAKAERSNDLEKAIDYLKQIVAADPEDYPAWGKLGARYFERQSLPEAEAAFKEALQLKPDYTPAWISIGLLRSNQKQFDAAIESYKHAAELDPLSPLVFRLLGEAYLQARKGTLGIQALDRAIELDPIGMAECHLEKGRLYELAGARQLAANEYKIFLRKVPDYPDKKRLVKFIEDNPD